MIGFLLGTATRGTCTSFQVLDLELFCPALVSFLMACYRLQQSVENYSLAAYMDDDDVINGKIYPSISSIREITKQVAAAVVKEAIEEDLTEGYREMDDRELKRHKRRKSKNMCRTTCGVQNTYMLIVIIFTHVHNK